jgi:hypothetical protein
MTGQEIAKRAADLREGLSSGHAEDHSAIHAEILSLIAALAERVSEFDHSQQVQLRTSPEGETIDV